MDSQFTIDLNEPSPNFDQELPNEEGEISIFVSSSSTGNFVIELTEENHVIEYPVIELDLHEFRNDNDGSSSDSSEEETIAQQIGDSNATITTNNEEGVLVDRLQTGEGMI